MGEPEEVQQHNMISNLPLLFANGYPTSLEKITEAQLEQFIPFMVQCSLGHINLQAKFDFNEPEWWPENVPFTIPFAKPRKFSTNWKEKMKELVNICYQFHRSVFLLRFCKDLATFEHASLRFINNYNSTTSLFDRRSNKLLVTFRNENMSYDQPQRSRKCLLQQMSKRNGQVEQQTMVEPAPFDIYLCEYCDAELYSEEAVLVHEKTCNLDDDVIICDSPEPQTDNQLNLLENSTENNNEHKMGFLMNFNLQNNDSKIKTKEAFGKRTTENVVVPVENNQKRLPPRRNRTVHSLARCPTIPLSSPAGQLFIKTSKTFLTNDYLMERLDRVERFCHTPLVTKGSTKAKYLFKKITAANCSFKKPQDYCSERHFVFPRRQFSQKNRNKQFNFFNSLLIKKCRPMTVRLKKMPEANIQLKRYLSTNTKLNIKLRRDASRSSNWKISSTPSAEIIVDTIDLCSSDEEIITDSVIVRSKKITETSTTTIRSINALPLKTRKNLHMKPFVNNIVQRLSSEITLTPIRKSLNNNINNNNNNNNTIKPDNKTINTHSVHISPRLNANNPTTPSTIPNGSCRTKDDDKKVATRYDGNILLSPTNGSSSSPKPLQPSVFFFSNYTTSPLPIVATNNSEIISPFVENSNDGSFQNQENHTDKSNLKRHSTSAIGNTTTLTDGTPNNWFPSNAFSSTAANNNTANISNNTSNGISNVTSTSNNSKISNSNVRTVDKTSRSLSVLQCKRIISIDLTS